MSDLFDLSNFDKYKEDNCREVKKAEGGLPIALWESYSSFANSNGGVIILGVGERQDGTWYTTGLKNADKLKRNFWNTIHDTKKVSINLLSDKNVESYEVNGDTILVIYVPRAKREQKPVYINNDLFGGCYRRDWEGDYHCSKAEIKGMLRDAADETEDMKIVEQFDISAIDTESLKGFRNHHKSYRPEHVFNNLPDDEYLERIGAAGFGEDGKLHPTTAGLLMFGEEYHIVREFPEYFLDYREMLDPTIRWTDRLQSSSGDWSGNVFDFFFRVNSKIAKDIKKPFKLEGITRVDDTPVHKDLLQYNDNFNNYITHQTVRQEELANFHASLNSVNTRLHMMYAKAKEDKTFRTDIPEEQFMRVTVHTMMAACTHYAGGFIWGATDNKDYTGDLLLLKEMILNYARNDANL